MGIHTASKSHAVSSQSPRALKECEMCSQLITVPSISINHHPRKTSCDFMPAAIHSIFLLSLFYEVHEWKCLHVVQHKKKQHTIFLCAHARAHACTHTCTHACTYACTHTHTLTPMAEKTMQGTNLLTVMSTGVQSRDQGHFDMHSGVKRSLLRGSVRGFSTLKLGFPRQCHQVLPHKGIVGSL